jgi:hypothetical protein
MSAEVLVFSKGGSIVSIPEKRSSRSLKSRPIPHSEKTTYQDLARVVTWCGAEDYFRIADNPLPIRPNQLKMLVFIEDL